MAHDRGLTATDLARLAATSPARITELRAIGVLVPVRGRYTMADGRTVILASRLSGAAGPGEIVLDATAATALAAGMTAAIGTTVLKGISDPVDLFRLLDTDG